MRAPVFFDDTGHCDGGPFQSGRAPPALRTASRPRSQGGSAERLGRAYPA